MKTIKHFSIFAFLLLVAFALNISAQQPKIVWKNLQEKYERFEDVKPTIINESGTTIYMFADVKLGIIEDYLELYRYFENTDSWLSVVHHKHPANKTLLKKTMSNFKLEPQQERPIIFDEEDWMDLTESNGVLPISSFRGNPIHKGIGKYKFRLQFYCGEKKSQKIITSESPVFEIAKEQKSYFDK